MLEWLEKLLEIQNIDLRMARIEEQLAEIPRLAEETKKYYMEENQAYEEAKKAAQALELKVRKIEKDIDTVKEQKKNLLSKSAIIKNNDEYRAAMLQIEMCDHTVSDYETEILSLMDKLDEAKAVVAEKNTSLNEAKSRAEGVIDELRTKQTNCKNALTALQAQREPLVQQVEQTVFKRYERLRTSRNNLKTRPCVVPVEFSEEEEGRLDGCCGHCHVKLPTQILNNTLKGTEAVFCPSCSAILYSIKNP